MGAALRACDSAATGARGTQAHRGGCTGTIGKPCRGDPTLNRLHRRAARLAAKQIPLILQGETGTGKEKLARAIHVSRRAGACLACCAMCGCDIGNPAFTPYRAARHIVVKGADELSSAAQATLLDLIEKRADLRVIATCQSDLADERAAGQLSHRSVLPACGRCDDASAIAIAA